MTAIRLPELRALSDPTRQAILLLLSEPAWLSQKEIRALLVERGTKLDQSGVCHHLHVLKSAGLIRMKRAGQTVRVSLVPEALVGTFRDIREGFLLAPPAEEQQGQDPFEESLEVENETGGRVEIRVIPLSENELLEEQEPS